MEAIDMILSVGSKIFVAIAVIASLIGLKAANKTRSDNYNRMHNDFLDRKRRVDEALKK